MAPNPSFASDVFSAANRQMIDQLALIRKLVDHPGEKGAAIENAVAEFWRKHLPAGLGITTGFVMDTTGTMSKQMDLIFYDASKTPVLFSGGSFDVIPVECTIACCEVKASLSSKQILDDCFAKADSYKGLKRSAYEPSRGDLVRTHNFYGEEHASWQSLFFIFALSGSVDKVADWYAKDSVDRGDPSGRIVDAICLADSGLIAHASPDRTKFDFIHGPSLVPTKIASEAPILLFYMLAARYLLQADIGTFRPAAYLSMTPAQADVIPMPAPGAPPAA